MRKNYGALWFVLLCAGFAFGGADDSLSAIEIMPQIKQFVKANYPPDLVKQGIEGTVILDIVVSDSGRVDSVAVVKGFNPRLDSAALSAASMFTFSPAIAGGKPVAVLMEYAYRFSLDEVVSKIDEYVNLNGRLLERGTRAPITNATIAVSFLDTVDSAIAIPFGAYLKKIGRFDNQSLVDGTLITSVDSLGNFMFKSLPACSISIKVIAPDFESMVDRERIGYSRSTDVTYRLARISFGDNEIVVYGRQERKEVAQRTLTLNEVRKIPGMGGDAVKVIQAMPGVARTAFGTGIVIRGSAQGDSRFFLDGIQLPLLFHFGGLTSVYNSAALETVDLYPGGFGTRYGGALGGVVEIKSRKPKTDRVHGYLDVNVLDASFLVEGPLAKNVSFLLSGRRSYIADVLSFALSEVLHVNLPFTVAPYYWDYLARVDAQPAKGHHCYVTLFGAKDAMELVTKEVRGGSSAISEEKDKASMDIRFDMGIAGWDWDIGKSLRNELRYALSYDRSGFAAFGYMKLGSSGYEHYFRDQLTFSPREEIKWNLGLDMDVFPYDLNLTATDGSGKIVRDTSHYTFGPIGAYVNADWKITPRLLVTPGLRFDYYPELRYAGSIAPEFWNYKSFDNRGNVSGEPSLRLTARYILAPRHTIKASLGNYNQTPQPMGQAIDKDWGEPDLVAEKGSQYVAGYEWKISDLVSLDAQTYFNWRWDNARSPVKKELADPSAKKFYDDGKARMAGLEVLLKHDQGKRFFGWLAYCFSRSERWNYQTNSWTLFEQDQTHYVQLIGNYRLTTTQDFGVRFRYVTGDPTTPILGVDYYDATYRTYVPKYGAQNSARVPGYVSLDLRYEKKFVYAQWQWSAYLDMTHVENLFTKGYKSPEFGGYQWNYDYSEKSVFSDITRPSIGLRAEF
jgi:TonB family protein